MSQPTHEQLAAEVGLLQEALKIRATWRVCPECGALLEDGGTHYQHCRFAPVEQRAFQGEGS